MAEADASEAADDDDRGPALTRGPSARSTMALLVLASVPGIAAYRAAAPPPLPVPDPRAAVWQAAARTPAESGVGGPHRLQRIGFTADGTGLATAPNRRVWRTTDAGRSWTLPQLPPRSGFGLALRRDGTAIMGGMAFVRSSDGGVTWSAVGSSTTGNWGGAAFAGADTVVAVGERQVMRSTDAGVTWTPLQVPALSYYDVAFADDRRGLIVGGSGAVLRTADAGATWSQQWLDTMEMLRGVTFVSPARAIIVGSRGTILQSDDGGASWATAPSGTTQHLRSVAFADALNGVAVGLAGTTLRSSDGGRSWQTEASGTRAHLFGVAIAPDASAVAVGWGDTILRHPPLATPSAQEPRR